jgi:hypothetical protein
VTALIQKRPRGSYYAGLSLYALGGRVAEISRDDSAFYYRKARYIIYLGTDFDALRFTEDNARWIRRNFPYLRSVTTGSYVNFPYAGLPDYLEEYYGLHACRLIKIKEQYDPRNVFAFPQGIRNDINPQVDL